MLRQESEKSRKGKTVQEENSMRRFQKLDHALSRFDGDTNKVKSASRMLEAEHSMLMKGLAEAKLISANSSRNLQEAMQREQELVKQCRSLEGEVSFLQEDLAALKGTSANLQTQIEKARRRRNDFEICFILRRNNDSTNHSCSMAIISDS